MLKKIITFLAFFVLASCATFNAPTDATLSGSEGEGFVVFSLTSNGAFQNFSVKYQGRRNGSVAQWTYGNPLDWEERLYGRLVAIQLPVGEYEFYNFISTHGMSSDKDFSIPFEVMPGKAVYLGNIGFFVQNIDEFRVQVTDEFERDVELFYSRYTNIPEDEVEKQIVEVRMGE